MKAIYEDTDQEPPFSHTKAEAEQLSHLDSEYLNITSLQKVYKHLDDFEIELVESDF
jgi:hypothetical protein